MAIDIYPMFTDDQVAMILDENFLSCIDTSSEPERTIRLIANAPYITAAQREKLTRVILLHYMHDQEEGE